MVGKEKEVENEIKEIGKIDLAKTRLFKKGLKEGIENGLKDGIQIDIEDRFGDDGRYLMDLLRDIKDR